MASEQAKTQQAMPPRVVTAAELFWPPGRASRPSRIVVLLRGPPGSGKSAAARRCSGDPCCGCNGKCT